MGGSATACDILYDMMHEYGGVSSFVVKGGRLPSSTGKRSLVIVNSVSGNTKETISMMKEASRRNAEVICISAGGLLKEMADKHGHKHIEIPNLSLPRASLPYLLIPALKLIDQFLTISLEKEMNSIPSFLRNIKKEVSGKTPLKANIAKRIAYFLSNGFAFCFTSPHLLSTGTRFKNSLNENAKIHCLKESVLEASHNEIVPFTYDNNLNAKVLLLRWQGDSSLVRQRFDRICRLFADINQPVMEMVATERNLLSATVSSIYKLDYATIYMAMLRKVDPSVTPAIDILKAI
jgi:glucose/mannose-6-phosphate isomerase